MSDQDIDNTEYQEEPQEPEAVDGEGEEGEPQEPEQETEDKEPGGGDAGSDYVETDDPKIIKRFGHLTRKASEAERRALSLQRELDELKKQQEQASSKQQEPLKEVPAPDPDLAIDNPEEFKRQQKAHNEYVREDERRKIESQQQEEQSKEQNQQQLQQRVTGYLERAEKLGVEREKLAEAGSSIEPLMSEDLRDTILDDEDGPALTVHFHENVSDLSALLEASKQSPYRAGQVIERMRSKLKTAKKPKPQAPKPSTQVRGTRKPESAPAGGWSIS